MRATAKEQANGPRGPLGLMLMVVTWTLPALVLEGKQSKWFSWYSIAAHSTVSKAVF